jgi:hypothetical protein
MIGDTMPYARDCNLTNFFQTQPHPFAFPASWDDIATVLIATEKNTVHTARNLRAWIQDPINAATARSRGGFSLAPASF